MADTAPPAGRDAAHEPDQLTQGEEIAGVVARLSRRHRSGGRSIEHAAIMAEGERARAILAWIEDAGWAPEELPARTAHREASGLHGMRREAERGRARPPAPQRYVSPSDGLGS